MVYEKMEMIEMEGLTKFVSNNKSLKYTFIVLHFFREAVSLHGYS